MGIMDGVILILVLAAVVGALRHALRGGRGCCGNCSGCCNCRKDVR